jgi:hypothetical protein
MTTPYSFSSTLPYLSLNLAAMQQQARDAAEKQAHIPKKLLPWRKACCGGPHVAGCAFCFMQANVWVCVCIKKPQQNFKLSHIFCSQVLEEKLHLSTEVGKWDTFAERLID